MNGISNKSVTLLLGGVRSGKSHYAQNLMAAAGGRVAFAATAEALDAEMQQRIGRHRTERPASWTTVEAPLALEDSILQCGGHFDTVLVDCLTLWTSNLMAIEGANVDRMLARADQLCKTLRQVISSVVLASNEVGSGIMPESESGRLCRDLLGGMNQRVAAVADTVSLLVAGYPMTVKDSAGGH